MHHISDTESARGIVESFRMPTFRTMARNAVPHLVEGTLLPLGLFYFAMWLIGIWPAIVVSLAWCWGAVGVRVATHRRVPGLLVLGAVGMTARTVVSIATDSVFLYFLQPTVGTMLLATVFLLSAPAGRPLAARLADDFLAMPEWFSSHPAVRRFFVRITVLWGAIQLANAGIALWLLLSQPIPVFLALKTATATVVMGAAVAGCSMWFRRLIRHHGLSTAAAAEAG